MQKLFVSIAAACIGIVTSAQVPVSKEPHHPIVFENNRVRLLNVQLPPGDTTAWHLHSTPSVFILFTTTKTGSQLINKEPAFSTSTAGNILFENLDTPHTRTHRVWNMDPAVFHVMDIELLSADTGFTSQPLSAPNIHLKIDTPWVRAYSISLNKNDEVHISKNLSQFVLIAFNEAHIFLHKNGNGKKVFLKEGDFESINPADNFSIKNDGDKTAKFALVELK